MVEPQENSPSMSSELVFSCNVCVTVLYFKMPALVISAWPCASAKQFFPSVLSTMETDKCFFLLLFLLFVFY